MSQVTHKSDIITDGLVSGTSLKGTGLTSGRLPVVSTGGLIIDDGGLTYDTATDVLTSGGFSGDGSKLTSGVGAAAVRYAALNFGGF
jgi:hypothetical protein